MDDCEPNERSSQSSSHSASSKVSKPGSFEQQLEAARRASDVKKMILSENQLPLSLFIGLMFTGSDLHFTSKHHLRVSMHLTTLVFFVDHLFEIPSFTRKLCFVYLSRLQIVNVNTSAARSFGGCSLLQYVLAGVNVMLVTISLPLLSIGLSHLKDVHYISM